MLVLPSWNATNPFRRVRTGTASKDGRSTRIFESDPPANRTRSAAMACAIRLGASGRLVVPGGGAHLEVLGVALSHPVEGGLTPHEFEV